MPIKDRFLKALDSAEVLAEVTGESPAVVLRRALQSERESPTPNRPMLQLVRTA